MLELKDVYLEKEGVEAIHNLSFVLQEGGIVSLYSAHSHSTYALLEAIVGLCPIKSGYITLEGECVTPISAPFLRRQMCYLPLHLQATHFTVEELFTQMVIASEPKNTFTEKDLFVLWRDMNIAKNLFSKYFNQLEIANQQRILLSFGVLLHKPITLIAIPQDDTLQLSTTELLTHLQLLASPTHLVVLATANEALANSCDKRININ